MRNRDFSRIAAIWVKVPEIPEPDQLDSQTGSSRPSRGRVRVRSGQIRAHCTRNARQEANLNKQHKQRTTPTAFYDAAIRHSRFSIRHIIISGTQVPYLRLCLCLGFSHGPRCVCVRVSVILCAPFMRQPQSQPQLTDTASVFRTFGLRFCFTIPARFYDGNLRVSADRLCERASNRFLFPWIRSAYLVTVHTHRNRPAQPSSTQLSSAHPNPAHTSLPLAVNRSVYRGHIIKLDRKLHDRKPDRKCVIVSGI